MKVLVLGSSGLVGSSLVRVLGEEGKFKIIPANRNMADLFSFDATYEMIKDIQPDIVINAAAKVGGIVANNTNRTEFILENLKININLLESLIEFNKIKLINLGSSCIYPLGVENPIEEKSLMTGKLEPTNSPYAMAKLTAIEMGNALSTQYGHKIVNLMPTNLYGPNDNYSPVNSHVIPGLIFRMHKAKLSQASEFSVWGTGKPQREFLYVDDLSMAVKFVILNEIEDEVLNVGSGEEITISNLVGKIKDVIEFEGKIIFDASYPDGNPRKLLDSSKIKNHGWSPETTLDFGLNKSYEWFINNF